MRTIVIGAGAIGLACAYALRQRGCEVIVVEKGVPGAGCSEGNAGWICPSHSEPLPAPGLMWTSISWMLRRESPLYISPRAAPGMARFLWQFWRFSNRRDFDRGLEALAHLNRGTQEGFDCLQREGLQFELHRNGLLSVFCDERALDDTLRLHAESAVPGTTAPARLTRDEIRRLEPGLAESVVGGTLANEEYHVRPETLIRGYTQRLAELGVEVRSGVTVLGPAPGGIATSAGHMRGDAVLVAAGAWSGRLLEAFGCTVPLEAAKGYSVTVDASRFPLRRPVLLGEARIACTPFNGATRFGGTLELSGLNTVLDRRRVVAIRKGIAKYFPRPVDENEGVEWVGMRPLTPDGLPLLGRIPNQPGLFVATGHAMLGITLAPVTGALMADLMTGEGAGDVLSPFAPGRFAH